MSKSRVTGNSRAKPVTGLRGLAKALGVSLKTASKYVNDSRWKRAGLSKSGPWDAAAIAAAAAWRQANFPPPSASAPSPATLQAGAESLDDFPLDQRIKLRQVVERTAKIQLEREMKAGNYVHRDDVERGRVARVQAVQTELRNIRLLAIQLQGKNLVECESILEGWARSVCGKFARPTDDAPLVTDDDVG